jgi:hypothetical protein
MRKPVCSVAMLVLIGTLAVPAVFSQEQAKETQKKEDTFDKAGKKTEGALEKAGDATEKGLDATGKGIGAAVEHGGRGTVTGVKAAGKGLEKAGSAVAGVFGGGKDPDRDRNREAQKRLQEKGYYSGPVDGVIGSKTSSGLREFQSDNKLEATGKLDGPTAEKLGVE